MVRVLVCDPVFVILFGSNDDYFSFVKNFLVTLCLHITKAKVAHSITKFISARFKEISDGIKETLFLHAYTFCICILGKVFRTGFIMGKQIYIVFRIT